MAGSGTEPESGRSPTGLSALLSRGALGGGEGTVPFHGCENGVLERGTDCTKATQQLSIWGLGGKVLRPESPDTVL